MSCQNLSSAVLATDTFEVRRHALNSAIDVLKTRVCAPQSTLDLVALSNLTPRESCFRFLNGESDAIQGVSLTGRSTVTRVRDSKDGFTYSVSGGSILSKHEIATGNEIWAVTVADSEIPDAAKIIDGFLRVVTTTGNIRKYSLINGAEVVPDIVSLTAGTYYTGFFQGKDFFYTELDAGVYTFRKFNLESETEVWSNDITLVGAASSNQIYLKHNSQDFAYGVGRPTASNITIYKLDLIDGSVVDDAVWPIDSEETVGGSGSYDLRIDTDDEVLFFHRTSGTTANLRRFDTSTGDETLSGGWPFAVSGSFNIKSLEFQNGVLGFSAGNSSGTIESTIYRLDPLNGEIIWSKIIPDVAIVNMFIDNDQQNMYLGSVAGTISVLKIPQGYTDIHSWSWCGKVQAGNEQTLALRYRNDDNSVTEAITVIPDELDNSDYSDGLPTLRLNGKLYAKSRFIFEESSLTNAATVFAATNVAAASYPTVIFRGTGEEAYGSNGSRNEELADSGFGFSWSLDSFRIVSISNGTSVPGTFDYSVALSITSGSFWGSPHSIAFKGGATRYYDDYLVSRVARPDELCTKGARERVLDTENHPLERDSNFVQDLSSRIEGGNIIVSGRFARSAANNQCGIGMIPIPKYAIGKSLGKLELNFTLSKSYTGATDPEGVETLAAEFYVVPSTGDIDSLTLVPVSGIEGLNLLSGAAVISGSRLVSETPIDGTTINEAFLDTRYAVVTDDTIIITPFVGHPPYVTTKLNVNDSNPVWGFLVQNKVGPTDTLNYNDGETGSGGDEIWMICSFRYIAPINGGGPGLGVNL